MNYTETFVWRGLVFNREEHADQLLVHYRHGRWRVWSDIQLDGELGYKQKLWRAAWQGIQLRPSLLPRGHGLTIHEALDVCLASLDTESDRHEVEIEELQRRLNGMILEQNAVIKDLYELARRT